eukprot:g7027.t1
MSGVFDNKSDFDSLIATQGENADASPISNSDDRNNLANSSSFTAEDNDVHMMQSQLSSLMDSFMSAKEPSSAVADQVLNFSVKTPSPEANKDKSTLGQFNNLKINAPGDNNTYDYHGNNMASPKEDEAAFLPPDSPMRARSNSSELAITSKLLAETDALMNDTQALTSSKVSNTLKLDAAMDFFERESLAGRPLGNGDSLMSDNNDPAQDGPNGISPRPPTLSSPPQMPPPSYDNAISSRINRGDRIDGAVNDLDMMSNNSFLRTAEADLAQRQQSNSQKLTPAEMFLNDNENMPLGTSIVVRNADMARIDPYTDFRRLSKSQAEATGLFDSFSSRATEYCRVLEAKLRQDIHFDVVQEIFTSIILSRNLVVVMKEHGNIIAEDHREHRTVAMVVGSNAYKCRVMLVTVIFNSPQMGSANSQKLLDDFSNDFFGSMQEQLHEERVTLSSLMKGLRCQGIGPHPDGIPILARLANDYEGELKEAFKREMRKELAEFGEPLEQYAREAEWATALFIGALEFAFQKSGIPMPRPARTQALSDFPLEPPTEEQILLQKEMEKKRNSFNPNSIINLPYHEQIVILDKRLHVQLAEEMKIDLDARCKRKNAHIRSRVDKCDKHRRALVSLLKDSLAALGWEETQAFYEIFNIANESVFMSVSVSLGSRLGRLYITYNHIAFYSNILMFTKKKVIPLRDVVAVWKFDGLVGGVTILSNTHGEISFTIPMNQDRVFAVLEYLLKMHTKQNSNANLSKSADNSSPNIDGLSSYDGEDQNDNGLLASSKPSTSGVMVKSNTSSSGSHSSSSMLNSGGSTITSGESSSGGYLGMMDKMNSQTDDSQNIGVENEQHAQWL